MDDEREQDPSRPKSKKKKRFNGPELLKRFQEAQAEAERTGREIEIWDDYGFVGAVFPRETPLHIPETKGLE